MRPTDDRIDLTPLDPEQDPDRLDRVVAAVMDRLGPGIVDDELSMVDPVSRYLVGRFRIIFAAAAVVILAAYFTRDVRTPPLNGPSGPSTAGLELPLDWSLWVTTGQTPTTEDLLLTIAREKE